MKIKHIVLDTPQENDRLKIELDEARAERDILRSNKMSDPLLETTFKHLNRERDDAREALKKIKHIFINGGDTYVDFVKVGNIATDYLERYWAEQLIDVCKTTSIISDEQISLELPEKYKPEFEEFMRGKTYAILENGQRGVYSWDFEQYLKTVLRNVYGNI